VDPLSLLRAALPSTDSARLEGKVESVDARRGTVTVKLPGGETVVAQGLDLAAGDKVLVARTSDGAWVARSAVRPSLPPALAGDLSAWFGGGAAMELSKAAGAGDTSRMGSVLQRIWSELQTRAPESLPVALQAARERGLPPLAALASASASARSSAGVLAPLALREEVSPGVYRAEIAGRAAELVGPAGLGRGDLGLWTESVLDEILSLWLPASLEAGSVPELPARVGADANGARRLLDRLGVPVPASEEPSLRSLVRTLVRAAALLHDGAAAGPVAGEGGQAVPETGGDPSPVSDRPASRPHGSPIPAASSGGSGATAGRIVAAPPAGAEDPDLAAVVGKLPEIADPADAELPATSLPARRSEEGVPAAMPEERQAATVRAAGTPPADVTESVKTRSADPARRSPELPAATALRVLLAWSLADAEPSDAALRAAVGDAPDLPDALEALGKALGATREHFPAVTAFLETRDAEAPLLPRQLGLEKPAHPDGRHSPAAVAGTLAEAIASDLGAALAQGRTEEAKVLRDALRSLASEGFGAARDPQENAAASPWTMAPRQDRPDSGRVVVHDRRRHRDDPSRGTVVEVAMNPTGLGGVDARLELRGRDLDVRFATREAETAKTISEHLPELRKLLVGLGFEPRELDARSGKTRAERASRPARDGGTGLDIRA